MKKTKSLGKQALWAILRGILLAYPFGGIALWLFQDHMLLHPGQGNNLPALTMTPLQKDAEYVGLVAEPPSGRAKATVVFWHGNAGTVAHRQYLAEWLTPLGYRVVLLEYPGFGHRPGKLDIGVLDTVGTADFDWVSHRFADAPLLLGGESFGAGVAAQVAGARPDKVGSLVLVTPWRSLQQVAQEHQPYYPIRWMLKKPYDTEAALARYSGPLTIVGAQRDALIPLHHARALQTAYPRAQWVEVAGADHNSWRYYVSAADWQRWLSPPPP